MLATTNWPSKLPQSAINEASTVGALAASVLATLRAHASALQATYVQIVGGAFSTSHNVDTDRRFSIA